MGLSWKDAVTTLLASAVLGISYAMTKGIEMPIITNYRWGIAALGIIGIAMCAFSGGTTGGTSSLIVIANVLGFIAFGLIVYGLISGTKIAFILLTITILTLWAIATFRHLNFSRGATVEERNDIRVEHVLKQENKDINSIQNPLPRGNFSKVGNLTQSGNAWTLVYEEPGSPALTSVLIFTNQSICVFFEEKMPCDTSKLKVGDRVQIEGNKEANQIEVFKLTLQSDLSDEKITSQIVKALSEKYHRPASTYIISITAKDSTHAYGTVRFTDGMGGAIWHGALDNGDWILAADGQGPMDCKIADKYAFPTSMVPGCIDATKGNKFIQR